jgi:hypothetical protein
METTISGTGAAMYEAYTSADFQSLHTLQRRVGSRRGTEEHPYEAVVKGLRSLRAPRPRRRLAFRRRGTAVS